MEYVENGALREYLAGLRKDAGRNKDVLERLQPMLMRFAKEMTEVLHTVQSHRNGVAILKPRFCHYRLDVRIVILFVSDANNGRVYFDFFFKTTCAFVAKQQ